MRQKLNLITLGVKDFDRSLGFYEGLGWKKSKHSKEDMALFPLGEIVLALYPLAELAADAQLEYTPSSFSGISLSFNARSEQEVTDILEEAVKLGGSLVKPGQKVFWGGFSGYFKDPDGYLFEVAYNPFWELDENGNLQL